MARLYSAACERNQDPILDVLLEVLPREGTVLEISSGTGMHAAHFAPRLPALIWQPTDRDPDAVASIEAWREHSGAANLRPAMALDVTAWPWPLSQADAIFNANMIHIAPPECTHGLLEGAARVLVDGSPLVLYGPFRIGGEQTAPSNAAFDRSLKARDPRWGIRDLEEVQRLAAEVGLAFERRVAMPANNQCVVFRRRVGS